MLRSFKKSIQRLGRRLGVDVRPFEPNSSDVARLQAVIESQGIDLVLDVGANFGTYAESLRSGGYRGRVVCFEPLSDAHAHLQKLARRDPLLVVAPRAAIGAEEGETEINVSKNMMSSSLLPMCPLHLETCPESIYVGRERVRVTRLDAAAPEYIGASSRVLLKADTQGYEVYVVEGARGILSRVRVLQLELSLAPLYDGEIGFFDMVQKLKGMDYELFSLIPAFTDARNGRMLALDAIFIRADRIDA